MKTDYPRWQLIGVEKKDLDQVLCGHRSMDEFVDDDWVKSWIDRAQHVEKEAEAQGALGDVKKSGMLYLKASAYYMVAFYPHPSTELKKIAYSDSIRTFLNAVKYGAKYAAKYSEDVHFERVIVPFEGKTIVGYLFLPKGTGPSPCIIFPGGLDAYKEEMALTIFGASNEEELISLSYAGFFMDMPGTGENEIRSGPDAGRVFRSVINYLETRSEIDANRLGVIGGSFGGYWATWLAIHEPRIKAAISIGGPIHTVFAPSSFFTVPSVMRDAYASTLGSPSLWGLYRLSRQMSLKDDVSKITIPYLYINGTEDKISSLDDVDILLDRGGRKDLFMYPGETHCAVSKLKTQTWPYALDWLNRALLPVAQ